MTPRHRIAGQPGPQNEFLACNADIAIYGGAAGGGKSYGLLLDAAALAMKYKGFGAVIFRRTGTQVMSEGGLWDKSEELYPLIGGQGSRHNKQWWFPSKNSTVSFAHLEHEKDKLSWMGSEIAYIAFDELTHFSETQFWYLMSRNRSLCGCKPIVRGTVNPDPDSFVAKLVAWYIDQNTGYAIPERSGVIRYFIRVGDDLHWGASRAELVEKWGGMFAGEADVNTLIKSFTFIVSKIEDNKILMAKNPEYYATLMSLPTVERERLLRGNWKVRPASGSYFKYGWLPAVKAYPVGYRTIRYWDRAATVPNPENPDPDWTVGLKMTKAPNGEYHIIDVRRDRLTPNGVEKLIVETASADGQDVMQVLEQDPGQAGIAEVDHLIKALAGYPVRAVPKTKSTEFLCKGCSSQAEAGNIYILEADWNDKFVSECVNFPTGRKDDQVVTLVGAFNELTLGAGPMTPDNVTLGTRGQMTARPLFKPKKFN